MRKKLMAILMAIILVATAGLTFDRSCLSSKAASTMKVKVKGTRYADEARKLVSRVNEIRKEAYSKGYVSKYVPVKWSYDMEEIATLRAAEASVYWDHTRPNGSGCFTAKATSGAQSYGENLAWNFSVSGGLEAWYEEIAYYAKDPQDTRAGHYRNLIDENRVYFGMSGFSCDGYVTVAYESSFYQSKEEYTKVKSGSETATIEIQPGHLDKPSINKTTVAIKDGKTVALSLSAKYTTNGVWTRTNTVYPVATWSSSNKSVATVSSKGVVTPVANGTATITGKTAAGNVSCKVTVSNMSGAKISNCTISYSKNPVYTGRKITPAVTVKNGTKTLVKNTDYTVSYGNNIKSGVATITITGKGKYTGKVTKNFYIHPRKQTVSVSSFSKAFRVSYQKRQADEATYYRVKYADNKSFNNAKVVKIKSLTTGSKKFINLVSGKKYYVTAQSVKVSGTKVIHGKWATATSVIVK